MVPIGVKRADFADLAAVDALERFAVGDVVAPLGSGDDVQPFRLGECVRLEDGSNARRVRGDRLFGKDVLARID